MKIRFGGVFWFKDDLNSSTTKAHLNNTKDDER
jgi:hypothetical protein